MGPCSGFWRHVIGLGGLLPVIRSGAPGRGASKHSCFSGSPTTVLSKDAGGLDSVVILKDREIKMIIYFGNMKVAD